MKHYNIQDKELYAKVFTRGDNFVDGGFPLRCPECTGDLDKNDDFNYMTEWTASYTCSKCNKNYAYQPSDMGQTLPWLVKYNTKAEVFNR